MWFDFPTPFEKGDIVWIPKDAANIDWDCDGGFVLKGLSNCKSYDVTKVAKVEDNDVIFVEASSDHTMARVMNIMKELGWKYIRILNVSDIVDPDSDRAKAKIKKIIEHGYDEHCIFAESRREELDSLTREDAVYIISWGTGKELNCYKKLAMSYLKDKRYIGVQNKSGQYYHIKPRQNVNINPMIVAEKIIEQVRNLRNK